MYQFRHGKRGYDRFGQVILLLLVLIGCKNDKQPKISLPYYLNDSLTPTWFEEGTDAKNNTHSIPRFELNDQNGNRINNDSLMNKVIVANFFFSVCPGVYPVMMKNLQKVNNEFMDDKSVMLVSHTVMPWVDSVGQLHVYAEENNISIDNWLLLTGKKKEIYSLARKGYFADEGFGKKVTREEDFIHTENVYLIDTKGKIRGVYNGTMPLEMKRLKEDIITLQELG